MKRGVEMRKYRFEAGLGVYPSFKTLIPVEHLEELGHYDLHNYHIYAILAFEEYYFKYEKVKCDTQGVSFSIFAITEDGEKIFDMPPMLLFNGLDHSKLKMSSKYPYKTIEFAIEDDEFLSANNISREEQIVVSAQDIFQMNAYSLVDKVEYEVLYIGQAYGQEGERTALMRLKSHSTLQKILAEASLNYPNKHIFIMLFEIAENLNMMFDGMSDKVKKTDEESQAHMEEVLSDLPKEKQVINITEAAMINYFKPIYNEKLVNNFPNRNLKSYRQYFDLDYNSLTVELDLELDYYPTLQFYTENARINSIWEAIRYELFNERDRASMYDIFRKKGDNLA